MNKVILFGNVGRDPEIMEFENGAIVSFTLATSYQVKTDNGYETKTDWHNVTVKGNRANFAKKVVKKGVKLLVEGKLKTRSYEQDGKKKYVTEVVVNGFGTDIFPSGKTNQTSQPANEPSGDDLPF